MKKRLFGCQPVAIIVLMMSFIGCSAIDDAKKEVKHDLSKTADCIQLCSENAKICSDDVEICLDECDLNCSDSLDQTACYDVENECERDCTSTGRDCFIASFDCLHNCAEILEEEF